jgi:hypothetical protein
MGVKPGMRSIVSGWTGIYLDGGMGKGWESSLVSCQVPVRHSAARRAPAAAAGQNPNHPPTSPYRWPPPTGIGPRCRCGPPTGIGQPLPRRRHIAVGRARAVSPSCGPPAGQPDARRAGKRQGMTTTALRSSRPRRAGGGETPLPNWPGRAEWWAAQPPTARPKRRAPRGRRRRACAGAKRRRPPNYSSTRPGAARASRWPLLQRRSAWS